MPSYDALDLTEWPGADAVWRPRPASAPPVVEVAGLPALPRDGFASPLGFWFGPAGSWAPGAAPLRVDVVATDEFDRGQPDGEVRRNREASVTEIHRARLDPARGRGRDPVTPRSASGSSPLILEIDARRARIGVDPGEWPCVAPAVLLVVAQFWRLLAIDRALDDLTEWARDDIDRTEGAGATRRRWGRSRQLRSRRNRLQRMILDLPLFEGPLTDPGRYLPAGRLVGIHRALAARLGLGRRRRLIDERIEVVEAVLDARAGSLDHAQALLVQVVLELIIVAVLLLDVALFFLG